LLFTFGSGLKKLEQLEYIRSSGGSYIRSALYTLIALLFFGLWFSILVSLAVKGQLAQSYVTTGLTTAYALFGLAFLGAGVFDHLRAIDLPNVQRWVQRLKKSHIGWVDCFAAADPVSAGYLLDEPPVKQQSSKEICNLSSVWKDHTSYWANRDQFVTLLIQQLMQSKLREEAGLPAAPELAADGQSLDWIGRRRRWRVGILSAITWVAVLSVLIAVYQHFQGWLSLLTYGGVQAFPWASELVGQRSEAGAFTISWPALGFLALVLVPYLMTRWRWQTWNEARCMLSLRIGFPLWITTLEFFTVCGYN
jgi:hypothetical protein